MPKTSALERNKKRKDLSKKFAAKRAELDEPAPSGATPTEK